jgi:regulator of sigma D
MFGFFKNKSSQPAAAQQPQEETRYSTAPGTEIRYSPDLVDSLKADHQKLLSLYGEIKADFENKDYPIVAEKLEHFKSELQGHLLTENVRLYIYLDRSLASDPTNSELIRGFRREMDNIAKVAMGFINKYSAIGVDEDLASHFGKDFATIGKVLGERIQKEESILYPLYMPNYN